MEFGANVLPISNIIYDGEMSQILSFVKSKNQGFPKNCTKFYVINNKLSIAYNDHLAYIINNETGQIIKVPSSGEILHVEASLDNKYYVFYLFTEGILCDEVQGYQWDRENEHENGVKVNRRHFLYNSRQGINSISSSLNYLVMTTKLGDIFLVDKKDMFPTIDDVVCRTVAQVASIVDYLKVSNLVSENIADNIRYYNEQGILLNTFLRENNDNTLSLFVMLLVDNQPLKYQVFEHKIQVKTLSIIEHKFYSDFIVHGCNVCNEYHDVNSLIELILYFTKHGYKNIKILHCNKGSGGNIYATYRKVVDENSEDSENSAIRNIALKLDKNGKLVKWFDIDTSVGTDFEQNFTVKHAMVLGDGSLLLFHQVNHEISTNLEEDLVVEYMCIKTDKQFNIVSSHKSTMNISDLITILAFNETDCMYELEDEGIEVEDTFNDSIEALKDELAFAIEETKTDLDQQEEQEEKENPDEGIEINNDDNMNNTEDSSNDIEDEDSGYESVDSDSENNKDFFFE